MASSANVSAASPHERLYSLDDYRDALKRVDETLRAGTHPEWLHGFLTKQRSFLVAHVASKESLWKGAGVATAGQE
jgi:hypothetical protein